MTEYAYDVKLWAAVRVEADSEADARRAMVEVVDALSFGDQATEGYNEATCASVKVTEVSLDQEGAIDLVEVDGDPNHELTGEY